MPKAHGGNGAITTLIHYTKKPSPTLYQKAITTGLFWSSYWTRHREFSLAISITTQRFYYSTQDTSLCECDLRSIVPNSILWSEVYIVNIYFIFIILIFLAAMMRLLRLDNWHREHIVVSHTWKRILFNWDDEEILYVRIIASTVKRFKSSITM